jgi:hypothetical protein
MAVGAASYNSAVSGYQPLHQTQQTQTAGRTTTGHEAAAAGATTAKTASSGLPVDTHRGRNLNISV